jgi:hypothetical protein
MCPPKLDVSGIVLLVRRSLGVDVTKTEERSRKPRQGVGGIQDLFLQILKIKKLLAW